MLNKKKKIIFLTYNSLKNKLMKVNTAPDPTNIIWQNLDTPKREIFFRRALSFVLTVVLLVTSIYIF